MKKITALLLIFALALCLLTACGEKSEEKDTTEESVTQVTESETDVPEITVTVDLIVAVFEARGYSVFDESDHIEEISSKLTLEGDIISVKHIMREKDGVNYWAYVYEMELESDAESLYENRAEFVSELEGGACRRFGNIVVYGNTQAINEL